MENVSETENNSESATIDMSTTENEEQNFSPTKITPTEAKLAAEFDPNDKELCEAALKIQAAFRGHLSRRTISREQSIELDIDEITQKVAEELQINLDDPELNKAATKIQASFRGHKSRKDTASEPTE